MHRRLAQRVHVELRRGLRQDTGIGTQHALDHAQRALDIGLIGHANAHINLADLAVVVQNLTDDLAIGNHHL